MAERWWPLEKLRWSSWAAISSMRKGKRWRIRSTARFRRTPRLRKRNCNAYQQLSGQGRAVGTAVSEEWLIPPAVHGQARFSDAPPSWWHVHRHFLVCMILLADQ